MADHSFILIDQTFDQATFLGEISVGYHRDLNCQVNVTPDWLQAVCKLDNSTKIQPFFMEYIKQRKSVSSYFQEPRSGLKNEAQPSSF